MLKRNKHELNECVLKGEAPIFGYPPVLYSPPQDAAKNANEEANEQIELIR